MCKARASINTKELKTRTVLDELLNACNIEAFAEPRNVENC